MIRMKKLLVLYVRMIKMDEKSRRGEEEEGDT